MEQSIGVIDLKAFYAFAECIERKLDPFTTPLVVCDARRGPSTIVLSVTPYLKSLGVPSRCRKRELPARDDMIFASPRMSMYLQKSTEVIAIILNFVGEDDVHVYSIDECFVNLGPYLKMYQCDSFELIKRIQDAIFKETGLVSTAGIAENMFLAKAALDLEAKNKPPYIAVWTKDDIKNKLWKVSPLSKMWGISTNYERRLNAIGIHTVEDLAKADKQYLKQLFGIMGEQLWEHANGIDNTNIREKYVPQNTSLSLGQIFHEDYSAKKARTIIREMNDDLAIRLRKEKSKVNTVMLSVLYTYDHGGGFSHQVKLDFPSDDNDKLLSALYQIYDQYVEDVGIRKIYIAYGNLTSDKFEQLSLYEDQDNAKKRHQLTEVIDKLKERYGKNIILRASSLLDESTIKERHEQIGGHHK